MQQELNYEETIDGFDGELPYFFSPSITKKKTIGKKNYLIRSYFTGRTFKKLLNSLPLSRLMTT